MLVRATNTSFAHGTSGAARIRHSLRPLIAEGERYLQTSGALCRENAKLCLDLPSDKKSSLPQARRRCYLHSYIKSGAGQLEPLGQ